MTYVKKNPTYVNFKNTECIINQAQGDFAVEISNLNADTDLSLVIDVYDLDNPVHPEGHFGWWQFPVPEMKSLFEGMLDWSDGQVNATLENLPVIKKWVNESALSANKLQLIAVLRHKTNNAIVYLDKIPVFQSNKDYLDYAQHFSFDWDAPRFAKSWFVPAKSGTVHLISKNIYLKDAVGNFCFDIYRLCKQNKIPVEIYADEFDLAVNKVVKRRDKLFSQVTPEDTIIYFYSTYHNMLDQIMEINAAKKIVYFHGVTKPELLRVFDFELSSVCEKAYTQLPRLAEFDQIVTNSQATAAVLSKYCKHSKSVTVIPPRLLASDELEKAETALANRQQGTKFIYVGRLKGHKKIEDMIEFFAEYLKLDETAECWIVGGRGEKAYMDYLSWAQNHYLGDKKNQLQWLGQVSDAKLKIIYSSATAYLSMSEDEGFCVPLLEAMLADLPVFAYGIPAVREVLGETGVYFANKEFSLLAAFIHGILCDAHQLKKLTQLQRERAKELLVMMDGQPILRLLETTLSNNLDRRA